MAAERHVVEGIPPDPASHPARYLSRPAIAVETGADDRHIPPEHAEAVAAAVVEVVAAQPVQALPQHGPVLAAAGGTAPVRVTRR